MLPVISGFIFPNGETLENRGKGHRKTASSFIIKNGLKEKFREYESETAGGEDEFLMEIMGAVKVCHYCGKHYLYVPRVRNQYIKDIIRIYSDEEYIIKTHNSSMSLNVKEVFAKNCDTSEVYNKTVIPQKDANGSTYYIYNPNRNGD